ncbi:MarR family transcriptional regulator [Paucilactobacillus hokkaidonensis JCM 18461]|uniref:MarR family transcriptional regulator n=3 Tax=Paucilactobacillus hokkaidonensis TaxID=1193095 RepID=A0A0A1GSA2_9LACO|nr:MarR family transcriptional regulator [Paucilactobacillus hokkaidonensis]KRO09378.1 MarR family transcriptional regulator [Paucilactobacillus hokkaidonensis]BAP84885.1 MarR family transcriptional regulator [Paucilactobacillus hokkaidonensis JCM 18461]
MAINTGRLLKKASNQLTKNFDRFASQFDLTNTQMSIIDYLSRHSNADILQKDIENEFNIQRSTTTVLLQRMERKQLLFRTPSTIDARQKFVHLTDKTTHLINAINHYMNQQQQALTANFSTEEIKTFETILNYYLNSNEPER